jgi:peptidoglycan-associated lipoprotein
MRMGIKLLLALMLALTLAACKKEVVQPPTETPEPTTPVEPVEPTVTAADPQDFTDSRNFENGDSLLSQTVVYFEFDKSVVLAEYQSIVAAHAAYAASSASARYTLEGHADERGSREYNLGLGERRGNAVNGLFAAGGASGSQSDVVSYGEERPTCRESAESCWQGNRRVELRLTSY